MPDALLTFRELLDYTAGETARWEAWFGENPDALELPYADGRLGTVRGVVHHVFLVERRHTERLLGRAVSGYDDVPASPDAALFGAGRNARFAAYVSISSGIGAGIVIGRGGCLGIADIGRLRSDSGRRRRERCCRLR